LGQGRSQIIYRYVYLEEKLELNLLEITFRKHTDVKIRKKKPVKVGQSTNLKKNKQFRSSSYSPHKSITPFSNPCRHYFKTHSKKSLIKGKLLLWVKEQKHTQKTPPHHLPTVVY